jgi:hypothetical protein
VMGSELLGGGERQRGVVQHCVEFRVGGGAALCSGVRAKFGLKL